MVRMRNIIRMYIFLEVHMRPFLNAAATSAMAISLALTISTPAHAKPHQDGNSTADTINAVAGLAQTLISASDRQTIKSYLHDSYKPHCPPGLAKKHNGCLPPGIAKKYAVGQPLPPGIAAKRLPDGLASRLHPIEGYSFGQVDNDVVLISEATNKIVDAVTLLSAIK